MAIEAAKPQPAELEKKKRHRSPNYPAVGLKEALDRVGRLIRTDGKAGASPEIAAKHIGFASAHGEAYRVIAALKKFGLAEDKAGRIVPTPRAIEIISLPEKDERRLAAIRQLALLPQIYVELIDQYRSTGLPSDETLEGELKAYKGFNPNAVKEFIHGFKETLEFASLSDFSVLGSGLKAEDETPRVKVGDYIQWESRGQIQFSEPKRVRAIEDHKDGKFVLVDDEPTGIPIAEVSREKPPDNLPKLLDSVFSAREKSSSGSRTVMRQDVFSVTEGDVVLRWPTPLSADSIQEVKDWLKIAERKIVRSEKSKTADSEPPQET